MALKHNLLAMLDYKPKTGYDLYKSIFKPLRPTKSIIYRQLNEMAKEGLVSCVRVEQDRYPDRNVFSVTEAGREVLNSWYEQPEQLFLRDALLAQLWFGSRVDKDMLIALINKYLERMKNEHEYYKKQTEAFINRQLARDASDLDFFYWGLVGARMAQMYSGYIKWAEVTVKEITNYRGMRINSKQKLNKSRRSSISTSALTSIKKPKA